MSDRRLRQRWRTSFRVRRSYMRGPKVYVSVASLRKEAQEKRNRLEIEVFNLMRSFAQPAPQSASSIKELSP